MSRARPTLTDIRRALQAAKEAGLTVTSYTVDETGVRVFTAPLVASEAAPANDQTDELAAIAARIGDASRRA
jgi:hypothetical protein